MKYLFVVSADYKMTDGSFATYHGTYKTEKNAQKRIEDLHRWFPDVKNEKIERKVMK